MCIWPPEVGSTALRLRAFPALPSLSAPDPRPPRGPTFALHFSENPNASHLTEVFPGRSRQTCPGPDKDGGTLTASVAQVGVGVSERPQAPPRRPPDPPEGPRWLLTESPGVAGRASDRSREGRGLTCSVLMWGLERVPRAPRGGRAALRRWCDSPHCVCPLGAQLDPLPCHPHPLPPTGILAARGSRVRAQGQAALIMMGFCSFSDFSREE